MMRFISFIFLLIFSLSYGESFSYRFGRGLFIGNNLWIGSYLSLNYWKKSDKHSFKFEDLAFLTKFDYKKFRFFSEVEAKNIYLVSDVEKNRYWNFKFEIERLFVEYRHSPVFNIRAGRFLTPLGIWNKIHINALKWTVSDPLVSERFFPMFTTGLKIYGYVSNKRKVKYELFFQKNKSINASYNNLKPDNMLGLQIEKIFDVNRKTGINVGKFDEKRSNERYIFLGVYGKTKLKNLFISSEFYYANEKYKGTGKEHKEHGKIAYYIQGAYRVFPKNYLVLRKDGFYDSSDSKHINVWTFCYNFRPRFNMSIKAEYQLFEKQKDYIRVSFSILF